MGGRDGETGDQQRRKEMVEDVQPTVRKADTGINSIWRDVCWEWCVLILQFHSYWIVSADRNVNIHRQ